MRVLLACMHCIDVPFSMLASQREELHFSLRHWRHLALVTLRMRSQSTLKAYSRRSTAARLLSEWLMGCWVISGSGSPECISHSSTKSWKTGRTRDTPQYVNYRSEERRVGKESVSTCRSRW